MKKVIVILMVMTFISLKINAQYSIYAKADTTFTCGGKDTLWVKVSDWAKLNSGTSVDLYSVYFTDANTGYAVGYNGAIIQTTDGGNTWKTLTSGTTYQLHSVYFTNADTGYAVGDWGTILQTTNAGNTWKTLNSGPNLTSVYFPDANTGYAVGYGDNNTARVIKTTDGGNAWKRIDSTSNNLYSVYFTNADIGYAVGLNGIIIQTTDAGNTWETLNSGTTHQLHSVYFTDVNTGYAVGWGTIIKTTDAGNTWKTLNSDSSKNFYSVYFPNANTGYTVGDGGTIIKTTNAGNTWEILNSATSEYLTSVYFPNANTGYAVGGSGTIIKYQQPLELTYKWSPAAGLSATDIANPIASPVVTTTYKVTVTSNLGSVIDSVKVTLNPLPAEQICYVEFDTITLKNSINWSTNLSDKIDSVHIYNEVSTNVWSRIGSVSARASKFIDMNSNPFNQSYSYKISVKDICGFGTDTSAFHTTITLSSTYDHGTNTYYFIWSLYHGLTIGNYYLYGINTGGEETQIGSVLGDQNQYDYPNPYLGYVKFFVGFNTAPCTEKSNHLVKSNYIQATTGVPELGIKNYELGINIYPNPANDNIIIENSAFTKEQTISVYNIQGQLLIQQTSQQRKVNIDISAIARGIYFVEVKTEKGIAVKKFVKE